MTIADAPVIAPLTPPHRILLGPGPSPVDDRVLRMMSAPLVGHLDPFFVRAMDQTQELLRYVFETNNRLTMSVSGTGSAGMEAAVVNLIEPGEEIVICVNGYFGERMHEMALRAGAKPVRVECEWGGAVDLEKARKVFRESNASVLFAVHAETSTGVLQQIAPLREIVDDRDGFLMIDAVTSIGAHSIEQGPDEPAEAAANRAVNACHAQEDAVVAEAERKLGREHGPGVRQRFRNDARRGIIRLINDCRADPGPGRTECVPDKPAPM